MKNFIKLIFFFILQTCFLHNLASFENKNYLVSNDPIDVIIPLAPKDIETIDLAIEGIRKNCANVRKIIVISEEHLTNKAEWFNEKQYPFSKYDVALYLNNQDILKANEYMNKRHSRVGWYFAQLLKLYALLVIPDISSNVLIVDSDTVFLNPVEFITANGEGLYNPGFEYHKCYFDHLSKLLPGLNKVFHNLSGISHHMLFQKSILQDLFFQVESYHKVEFWKAFCMCVESAEIEGCGASEYEIYFNFVFQRTNQVHIRYLKWQNSNELRKLNQHRDEGFDYVSYHYYLRHE